MTKVNTYGASEGINANNSSGYGYIDYYSTGVAEYSTSYPKTIVDAWANTKFTNVTLKEIDGLSARLITKDEYELLSSSLTFRYGNYNYWTMSQYNPSNYYTVNNSGSVGFVWYKCIASVGCAVRTVINVYKSALETDNNE